MQNSSLRPSICSGSVVALAIIDFLFSKEKQDAPSVSFDKQHVLVGPTMITAIARLPGKVREMNP
jgi:hypothetical protein